MPGMRNSINNLVDRPLTVNLVGGRDGGGTYLTDEGHELIWMFRMVEVEHHRAAPKRARSSSI